MFGLVWFLAIKKHGFENFQSLQIQKKKKKIVNQSVTEINKTV